MKDNNYNCQMSHIVIGLSVIVFYKLAKVFKLNTISTTTTKEHFNVNNSLNDFVSNNIVGSVVMTPNQAQSLSTNDLIAYNQKLSDLINSINDLKNQQTNPPTNIAASPDNIQKLDLESQQQYQMFQIDYLNKQLQNAKDIINSQTIINNSSSYKPIKVYSSCIISNANGTTSMDVPVATGSTGSTSSTGRRTATGAISSLAETIGSSAGSGPGMGLGGGNNPKTAGSNFVNLASSTGVFNDFFQNLSNGNGNININL
jgi:hypothetical protein